MPRGLGPLAKAMLDAAGEPTTIRELAQRACIGWGAARYTASRLMSSGQLRCLTPAGRRPAIVVRAGAEADPQPQVLTALPWR